MVDQAYNYLKQDPSLALSNFDLMNIGEGLDFQVITEDVIVESLLEDDETYIANYTDAQSGGTHWYVIQMRKKIIIVFDPLGAPIDDVLSQYADKNKYVVITSSNRAQSDKSNMCGLWCLWFIQHGCDIEYANRVLSHGTYPQKEQLLTEASASGKVSTSGCGKY